MKRFYSNERGRSLVLAFGLIILLITLATMTLVAANFGLKNTSYRGSSMVSVKNAETGLDELINNLEEEANRLMWKEIQSGKSGDPTKLDAKRFGEKLEAALKEYHVSSFNELPNAKVFKGTNEEDFQYAAFVKEVRPGKKLTSDKEHPGRREVALVSYGTEEGIVKKITTNIELGLVNYPSMFNYVLSSNYRMSERDEKLKEFDIDLQQGTNYVKEPADEHAVIRQGNTYLLGGPDIIGNVRFANSLMHNPYSFHFTYANPAEWGGGNLLYGGKPNWYNFGKEFEGLLGHKMYNYKLPILEKHLGKIKDGEKSKEFIPLKEYEADLKKVQLSKHTRDKYSYQALMEVNATNDQTMNQQRYQEADPETFFEQTLYKDFNKIKGDFSEGDNVDNKKITNKGIVDIIDGNMANGTPKTNDVSNFNYFKPKIDLFNPAAYNSMMSRNTGTIAGNEVTERCIRLGSDKKCHHHNSRKNLDLVIEDEIKDDDASDANKKRLDRIRESTKELEEELSVIIDGEDYKQAKATYDAVVTYVEGDSSAKPPKPAHPPEGFRLPTTIIGENTNLGMQDYFKTLEMYELLIFAYEMEDRKREVHEMVDAHNTRVQEALDEVQEEKKNNKGFIGWWKNIGLSIEEGKLNREKLTKNDIDKDSKALQKNIFNKIGTCENDDAEQCNPKSGFYARIPSDVRSKVQNEYTKTPKADTDFLFIDKRRLFSKKMLIDQLNAIVVAPGTARKSGEKQDDGDKHDTVLDFRKDGKHDLVFGWNARLARKNINASSTPNGKIIFNRAYFGPPRAIKNIDTKEEAKDKHPTRRLVIGYPNLAQIHNNLTLEGALFVDGGVIIRKATLNGRFIMYVNGDVEIDHSHFGYPKGHKSDGPMYNANDAMFIFATGNVKIKNISHHRDKPSVFRGFIYAGENLEIQGGDTNLNIIGGVSANNVFVSSLRGPNYPVIKFKSEDKGVDNYGVESFTTAKDQKKQLGRVRLIHDESIGEEYVKLMEQYNVNDKNIFETEGVPMGGQQLSTLRPDELVNDVRQ
ncbi:hypothetical protein GOP80_09780 [Planococcaceae bacterium Storch 2/2-2]|nr:hypothetical protein [Planococcaceae bacterium Storch 2/2-2]